MEERIKLYEEWRQSGLKKTEFCSLKNLSRSNFYKWLREIRINNKLPETVITTNNKAGSKGEKNLVGFIKMPEIPNIGIDFGYLEIALPNGINFKVKISPNNIDNFLERILTWK